jgi:predicted DNA-binding transcriptional regulator AlpA
MMDNDEFPKSVSFGCGRGVFWFEHEVDQWFDSLMKTRKGKVPPNQ